MGTALVTGWINSGVCVGKDICLYDVSDSALQNISDRCEGQIVLLDHDFDLADRCKTIVIAVKPKDLNAVSGGLKERLDQEHLLCSIVAGVPLSSLERLFPGESRLIRIMPNIAALVGESASAFCRGRGSTGTDVEWVERFFGAVGSTVCIQEDLMDSVTGLSGSGPAYAFLIMDALAEAGVSEGIPRQVALHLAAQTLLGASRMVLETGTHPCVLKNEVTSPGGTTSRGLLALEERGIRSALIKAVSEATKRSRELGETR